VKEGVIAMLKGESVILRPVHQTDLQRLYEFHQDIANRGPYFPIGVMPEPIFQAKFSETGFWQEDDGMLLIVDGDDTIIGHVEFFRTVRYLDELELSYHIYSKNHSGKGIATEAVELMSGYLFDRKKQNRIRLIIHPDNSASKRVAEKCGYRFEGTNRGAWFHKGRNHDVDVYALLRDEFYERPNR
jgi:RimJ/RimL family protein N-acetyltransferase